MPRRVIVVPVLKRTECQGCGLCAAVCRQKVLAVVNGYAVIINAIHCDYCGLCEAVCVRGGVSCPYDIHLTE